MTQKDQTTSNQELTGKSSVPWNIIIKMCFTIIVLGVIIYQFKSKENLIEIWETFRGRLDQSNIFILILACVLMPVNWLVEAYKWRYLLPSSARPSLKNSYKAIFGGITFSLLTPNRIGEYGGRMLFVPSRYNWKAVIASVVGSFSQNIVHIAAGFIALYFYIQYQASFARYLDTGTGLLLAGILLVLVVLYFRIDLVSLVLQKIKLPSFFERGKKHLELLREYSFKVLRNTLILSLSRYIIFSFQFVLLLMFFGVDVPLVWLWLGVSLIYLFHTSVPLPPLVDVLARTEIAMMIWKNYDVNELSVLCGSFFIWIVNLLIPAIIGLIAIENVNILKSLGYETGKTKI